MRGSAFAHIPVVKEFLVDSNKAAFTIVHHRAATTGDIKDDNAHPFTIRNGDGAPILVGAHNGIISNYHKEEDGRTFEVDSEWALYRVFRDGDASFKDFTGYFTLIYYDYRNNTVNFVADGGRSLYLGRSSAGVMFTSEKHLLETLAEQAGLKSEMKIEPLPLGVRIQFDADTLEETSVKLDIATVLPPSWQNNQRGSTWHGSSYDTKTQSYYDALAEEGSDPHSEARNWQLNRDRIVTEAERKVAKECLLDYASVKLLTIAYDKNRKAAVGTAQVLKDGAWKGDEWPYVSRMMEHDYWRLIKSKAGIPQFLTNARALIYGIIERDGKPDEFVLGVPYPKATPANQSLLPYEEWN